MLNWLFVCVTANSVNGMRGRHRRHVSARAADAGRLFAFMLLHGMLYVFGSFYLLSGFLCVAGFQTERAIDASNDLLSRVDKDRLWLACAANWGLAN